MDYMAVGYKLREFTVEEYHRMVEAGVLDSDERIELLDGAIVEMAPLRRQHWVRHAHVSNYLITTLSHDTAFIVLKGSFPLGDKNEPQPDFAILAPVHWHNLQRGPTPAEMYAVIELADSTLPQDVDPKLRLYARYAIADYLLVDLAADVLLHYQQPHDLGYRTCDRLGDGDTFELAALPGIRLQANAFLARGI